MFKGAKILAQATGYFLWDRDVKKDDALIMNVKLCKRYYVLRT